MKKTPLYDFHKAKGHLTEYAGFEMPVWYSGPVEEHLAVRKACGIFDISHMGRLIIAGTDAAAFLDYILTNSCTDLESLVARQAFLCNSSGGIIDDILMFRLEKERFMLIVNAINTRKDVKWMEKNVADFDVEIEDVTSDVPMIAIQGPKALQILQTLSETNLSALRRFHAAWIPLSNRVVLASRTGYTGEDGMELYVFQGKEAGAVVRTLWDGILEAGKGLGIEPCGLASRDSLRLEAGLCLNGSELNEETTPIEAGLKYGVSLDGRRFVGKEALSRQLEKGLDRVRVGFKMLGRGVPRKGMEIVVDGKRVGLLTSGTFSPLLRIGIGMGYIPPEYSDAGTEISVMIRRRLIGAEIVKLPFYDEGRYGWRREKK